MALRQESLCRLDYFNSAILYHNRELFTGDEIDNSDREAVLMVATLTFMQACNRYDPNGERSMLSTVYTDQLHTPIDAHKLWVRNWPVETLSVVKISDRVDSYDIETATNYTLINKRYIQYPAKFKQSDATWSSWTSGDDLTDENAVQLTYTGGYVTTDWQTLRIYAGVDDDFDVPTNIEDAVGRIALQMLLEGLFERGTFGIQSQSRLSESITIDRFDQSALPRTVKETIEKYRDISEAF